MRKTFPLFAIFLALSLSGCASIVSGDNQTVSITALYEGKSVTGAMCTANNDEGTWYVTTPGSIILSRSGEALVVVCEKEGYDAGIVTVESSTKPMAFGNILFGGIIGAAVDAGTGAAFDYPQSITILMGETTKVEVVTEHLEDRESE